MSPSNQFHHHLLLSLPTERLQDIAFLLVADAPLGPPSALLPLLLVCRHVHAALSSSPALLARIFRLKFDAGAVTRRLFVPRARDLAEQLVASCHVLRFLRGRGAPGDVDADVSLDAALLMMLDNDGKNYAQLAHAGIHAFLRAYAHTRVWERREENEGWPLDSMVNRAALWLMWLTAERGRLLDESTAEREAVVDAIIPFAVLPQRYAASYAPPNHFSLPLPPSTSSQTTTTTHQPPITFPLPNSHLRYPHYPPHLAVRQPYFNARIELTPPPCSIPAKLLFVARRELRAAVIPAHVPPGPGGPGMPLTQDDYHALNRAKAAVLPRGATWDWDAGEAVAVNLNWNGGGAAAASVIQEGDEESRRWDATFWKMRLCGDIMAPRPVFEPGMVYDPGSMSGLWQGKTYIPMGTQFSHVLQNPIYPSIPHPDPERAAFALSPSSLSEPQPQPRQFSESSLQLIMQPTFVDMREHHRICMCAPPAGASASTTVGSEHSDVEAMEDEIEEPEDEEEDTSASTSIGIGAPGASGGCGIVPAPTPRAMMLRLSAAEARAAGFAVPGPAAIDAGSGSGANAADGPGVVDATAGEDTEEEHTHLPTYLTGAGPPIPAENMPSNTFASASLDADADADVDVDVTIPVDLGMCNAWFEGEQGGVSFVPRQRKGVGGRERREEVVVATGFGRVDVRARGGCVAAAGRGGRGGDGAASDSSEEEEEGGGGSSAKSNGTTTSAKSYVYETYDPAKLSSHDVLSRSGSRSEDTARGCTPCALRDAARREQKKREEEEGARRILDQMMQGFGRAAGRGRGRDDQEKDKMDVDEHGAGAGEEMADLDMHDFAAGFEDVVRGAFGGASDAGSGSCSGSGSDGDLEDADAADDTSDDASGSESDSDSEFATHICVPGQRRYARVYEDEDDHDHDHEDSESESERESAPNSSFRGRDTRARGRGIERKKTHRQRQRQRREGKARERPHVLGDGVQREKGYLCFTCLGAGAGAGGELQQRSKRKRSQGHGHGASVSVSASRRRAGKRVKMDAEKEVEGGFLGTASSSSSDGSTAAASASSSSHNVGYTPGAQPQPQPLPSASISTSSSTSGFTHPHSHPHPHKTHTIPPTRREFARARIGVPCTGIRDILLSGARPPSTALYQDFSLYGRVRAWDGLVGMLRMSRAGGGGGGGEGAKSFLFVFGYVVGGGVRVVGGGGGDGREMKRIVGGSFVGEWRMAGSDPMRPSWGGPFVMSRVDDEV